MRRTVTLSQHPCAVCHRLVPNAKLMCVHHWHQVPDDVQRAVYSAWRALNREQTLASLKAYRYAREEAIQSVTSTLQPGDSA